MVRRGILSLFCIAISLLVFGQTAKIGISEFERQCQENEIRAFNSIKGKSLGFETFVESVRMINGRAVISSAATYDGSLYIVTIAELAKKSESSAKNLMRGDRILVIGTATSRTVRSRDVVSGGFSNGSGGVGTSTVYWPEFKFKEASFRIVETAKARAAKQAQANAEQEKRDRAETARREAENAAAEKTRIAMKEAWSKVDSEADLNSAKTAIELGVSAWDVNAMLRKIREMDRRLVLYPKYFEVYRYLLGTKQADKGNELTFVLIWRDSVYLEAILDAAPEILTYKRGSGTNLLGEFIMKDAGVVRDPDYFQENDYLCVKLILSRPAGKLLATEKDAYGKTIVDYVESWELQIHPSHNWASSIRKLIRDR